MKNFFENQIIRKEVGDNADQSFAGENSAPEQEKNQETDELEKYKQQAQDLVDSYRRFFMTFAKDISLSFKISDEFYIDLEKGEVNLDVKWFSQKDCSQAQILWACQHELVHFCDLAEDEGVVKNFEYIKTCARQTGQLILSKWEEKYSAIDPEFVESLNKQKPINPKKPDGEKMSSVERAAFDIHHTFYNIFDDIYANNRVARKSPTYEKDEKGGKEVARLYQEKLFAGNDYHEKPRHLQLIYALIRNEMVPTEQVVVGQDVHEILQQKIEFQGKQYTPAEIVENFIKPRKNNSTLASQRYFALRKTLEPLFNQLLLKDLEEWDPQKPPEQNQQSGQGENEIGEKNGKGNPFKQEYEDYKKNNPDQLNEEEAAAWKEKKDWEDENKKKQEAQVQTQENKSPEEKAQESQAKMDEDWCRQNGLKPETLQQFKKIQAEVEPYLQELSKLWQKIIFGSSKKLEREVEGNFKTGTELDIQQVIGQWSKIAQRKFEDVRVMKRTISREVLIQRPELIRVRLVGDMSGSMNKEKKHILQQCFVLLLSSLREFNTHLNLTRSQTKSKLEVDTEAWIFGDEAQRVKKFRSEAGSEDEQIEIVKIFEKLSSTIGYTCDHKAMEKIQQSLSQADLEKIAQKKILEIVLEVTDGGSTVVKNQEAKFSSKKMRKFVDKMLSEGVITRGFQIGETSKEEKKIFNEVWNNGRQESHGEIVGEDIANLLPAVASALKKYLGNVRL